MASIREDSNTPPTEESPLQPGPPRKVKRSDIFLIYSTFLGMFCFGPTEDKGGGREKKKKKMLILLGVFIASADEFVVLSTYTTIASEFHRLSEGSWLLVAYNFGYCISLPVVSNSSQFERVRN